MKIAFRTIRVFFILTIITGIIYPLIITGIAKLFFKNQAEGSMISYNDKIIGSILIGQKFTKPEFFWGRPSAVDYNPAPSGASNFSPTSEKLKKIINDRADTIKKYHGNLNINQIPADLLYASGSGVDPHISPEAAYFQASRIAKYRNFNENKKKMLFELVRSSIEKPDLFIFGQPRINVLLLNLKLLSM